ncbi:hypothetical protein D9758_005422 [Tetrapyrgos nigripes]|uniref:Uncharacterized protein n=1 Tax=Tetrapyrgos nigripes TaxID=182062 RepID=A0A8H5GHU0_9AGAR|nr:hypothetical protein D9758_005422 [Tetrapyrgos nigripes]
MNSPLTPRNVSKRFNRSENTPPHKHARLTAASARRKVRHGMRSAQYDAEKAKIRSRQKPIRFIVQTVAPVSEGRPTVSTHPLDLPRALGRPTPREASAEAIKAATGSHYEGQTAEWIRDCLRTDNRGFRLLRTNASVTADVDNKLTKETTITVSDPHATDLPTHMLAVYSPPKPKQKAQLRLFPVHAMVVAAHCSRMPAFPPSPNTPNDANPPQGVSGPRETTIPVRPVCLPHPASFSPLLQYMYTGRPEVLLRAVLPTMPAEQFLDNPLDSTNIMAFATELGRTYVVNVLLENATIVHGLWTNACALGIFDDGLWTVIDACWEVLLQALAIGTGNPRAVSISDMRPQEPEASQA